MNRRKFCSIIMGVVAAVYVPSMPWAFEEAGPEPLVSADGGFVIDELHTKEMLAAFEKYGMIVGPRKLIDLGPVAFGNMT